ncbi:glutamate-1-semialdehyde aminotransferase [Sphingomonas sp. BE138]|uniref:aminotransferase class III-fold pyridoxal phosphate-dependent enzyme n=1 Tax=Sphingomonas sp. BE138 TaxID=2817845 RepID=UPI0028628E0C|nr:aminotransferase class III-fold pyridoxal phosphate-dependent enzyme [Sphingomonas sp. BE138]MDR6788013.1 glutamate-1-semialdehyde aminotransferase [Sphingomonas sp. BE138]
MPDTAGIPPVLQDEVLIAPFNDLDAVAAIMDDHRDTLAAVIVEAQQRCIDPAPGFLEGLRELCTRNGAVLIFDEVVTGFRLAYGGAQEFYGVTPDLATYGKIVGGGLPLSAVAGRADIMALGNPRRAAEPGYCYLSSTMSGNPVAAAAGLATLDVLRRPGTYERLFAVAERIREGARASFAKHGVAAKALGNGPIVQFAFTGRDVVDYRTSHSPDNRLLKPLVRELVKRGVLTHGKFYCSLALGDEDVKQIVSTFDDALAATVRLK